MKLASSSLLCALLCVLGSLGASVPSTANAAEAVIRNRADAVRAYFDFRRALSLGRFDEVARHIVFPPASGVTSERYRAHVERGLLEARRESQTYDIVSATPSDAPGHVAETFQVLVVRLKHRETRAVTERYALMQDIGGYWRLLAEQSSPTFPVNVGKTDTRGAHAPRIASVGGKP